MVNTATAAAARLLQLRHSELGGFTHYVATRRVPPPPPPATRGNCPHRGGVPRGSEPFLTRKNLCTKLHKTILISLSLLIKGGTRTNLLFSRTVLHQASAGHYRQYPIRLFTTNSTQQLASPRISPQSALLSDILIINTATHSRAPRNSVPFRRRLPLATFSLLLRGSSDFNAAGVDCQQSYLFFRTVRICHDRTTNTRIFLLPVQNQMFRPIDRLRGLSIRLQDSCELACEMHLHHTTFTSRHGVGEAGLRFAQKWPHGPAKLSLFRGFRGRGSTNAVNNRDNLGHTLTEGEPNGEWRQRERERAKWRRRNVTCGTNTRTVGV